MPSLPGGGVAERVSNPISNFHLSYDYYVIVSLIGQSHLEGKKWGRNSWATNIKCIFVKFLDNNVQHVCSVCGARAETVCGLL